MNRILILLIALALPFSLLAGRVWIDPATTPNAALIVMELRSFSLSASRVPR